MCVAQVEISTSLEVRNFGGIILVRQGRPQSQLEYIRKLIEEHDAGCWTCSEGRADADPADETESKDDT